jgi:hypothetical protein
MGVGPVIDEHCEKHGWHYEVGDECPCCLGEKNERERIIAILNKMSDTASATGTKAGTKTVWVIENAIALIEREKTND